MVFVGVGVLLLVFRYELDFFVIVYLWCFWVYGLGFVVVGC